LSLTLNVRRNATYESVSDRPCSETMTNSQSLIFCLTRNARKVFICMIFAKESGLSPDKSNCDWRTSMARYCRVFLALKLPLPTDLPVS
jgi:hypothetical protein